MGSKLRRWRGDLRAGVHGQGVALPARQLLSRLLLRLCSLVLPDPPASSFPGRTSLTPPSPTHGDALWTRGHRLLSVPLSLRFCICGAQLPRSRTEHFQHPRPGRLTCPPLSSLCWGLLPHVVLQGIGPQVVHDDLAGETGQGSDAHPSPLGSTGRFTCAVCHRDPPQLSC